MTDASKTVTFEEYGAPNRPAERAALIEGLARAYHDFWAETNQREMGETVRLHPKAFLMWEEATEVDREAHRKWAERILVRSGYVAEGAVQGATTTS